jgi:hypothetical protein
MEAYVEWIPFEKGGRQKHLPENTRYCPIIVFPEEKTEDVWSAEILTNSINDNNESMIDISFLFPEKAPLRLLEPGIKFELYEGRKLVASGVILREKNSNV